MCDDSVITAVSMTLESSNFKASNTDEKFSRLPPAKKIVGRYTLKNKPEWLLRSYITGKKPCQVMSGPTFSIIHFFGFC